MCDITGEQPITSLRLKVLLKVKRLKNMMNLNSFTMGKNYLFLKRTKKKGSLSVHSQVKLKLVYIVGNIQQ